MFSGQQTQILKAVDKGWVTALAAGTVHGKQVGYVPALCLHILSC